MASTGWMESSESSGVSVGQIGSLRTWLIEQAKAPHDHISTVHLDELGILRWRDLELVDLEPFFREGVRLVASLGDYFKFLLVLPVRRTRRLIAARDVNFDFLLPRRLASEFPSIYLLRPPQYLGWDLMEEYRFPLSSPFRTLESESHHVYFRQFRSVRYIQMSAEYENAIFFEQVRKIKSSGGGPEPIVV